MIEFQFPVIFHFSGEWYFVTKIVLTYCEKKLFQILRKILKFEAEGREFAKSALKVRKTKIKEFFLFFYSNNKENHQSEEDDDDEVQEVSS